MVWSATYDSRDTSQPARGLGHRLPTGSNCFDRHANDFDAGYWVEQKVVSSCSLMVSS